ncbi:hypothetical protein K227x_10210 [Rubripirellula lacrimiformis]|uniref:VWFA domain-containing protein n=1 Tax=Rubripirellula lacrimiformis TaxID=1930273 RepID=A0A517N686_9BACT|nr:VWA domain-containing protein [Rubripirellula lacrimiformis]QDT02643.1 hypothetical protein K227x_10210 [Rubripirellula lacrimiformis]
MIDALSEFHFIRPLWLLMAPLAILLWWAWQRLSDPLRGWRQQIDGDLLEALIVRQHTSRDLTPYATLAGWILAVIAIAGPSWMLEPNPFAKDAQPIVIVLKADDSMQQSDLSSTALQRAQRKISDLAQARKADPLGLYAYAGSAHLVLPPTHDTAVVAQMAAEISPQVMPVAGDRLDLAIAAAGDLLQQQSSGGSILVVADTVQIDPKQVTAAYRKVGSPPIQFLALGLEESPETKLIAAVAKAVGGTVQPWTVDDTDIQQMIEFTQTWGAAGIAGESVRWQESGYWLTPLIAAIVAISFRRKVTTTDESNVPAGSAP